MFVVAITELAGAVDGEAPLLAADVGVSAYDARLLLAPGPPVLVKTTPDKALALEILGKLRSRGHTVVACDTSAVVASGAMVAMKRPRLGATAITLEDRPAESLPYDEVLALVPAVHRRRSETTTQTRETRLSMGRAIATGGVAFTKSVKIETHSGSEEREAVLYVFRRSGATPWLLRERGTSWAGTGLPLAPSEGENFRLCVARLRELATSARFDDRLVSRKAAERTAMTAAGASTTVKTSSESGVDLLAHVLGLAAARSAYR